MAGVGEKATSPGKVVVAATASSRRKSHRFVKRRKASQMIAVAIGISFTMLLGGGLMGLVFLSNGTGHDAAVDNKMPSRDELWSIKDED